MAKSMILHASEPLLTSCLQYHVLHNGCATCAHRYIPLNICFITFVHDHVAHFVSSTVTQKQESIIRCKMK